MDNTLVSLDAGLKTDSNSYRHHGQTLEELKQLLLCATVELDSARAAAQAQTQLHEARVRHLEELLKTTRRERDEAREQCKQWQWRVSQSSGHCNGSPGLSEQRSAVPQLESVSSVLSSLCPLESVSSIRTRASQVESVSSLRPTVPPLESIASIAEPTRATMTQVHRKFIEQQHHELKHKSDPVSSVSSMTEPTRATLTEVHRKLQEQQQHHQLQQFQHQIELHHQQNSHSQHDPVPPPAGNHPEIQSKQHQQRQLQQQLDMQRKDPDEDLQLDMDVVQDHVPDVQCSETGKLSESKNTAWDDFSSAVHLDIPVSGDPCLLLNTEQMHIEGVLNSHVNSRPPQVLEELQQRVHQQQEGQLKMRLQLQQEPDLLLSQMQQRQCSEPTSLRVQDDPSLHRQLNQYSDVAAPVSTLLTGANDCNLNIPVLQHPPWPGVLSAPESSQISMVRRDHQGISDVGSMPCYMVPELSGSELSNGLSTGLSEQLLQSSCLTGGSVVASILSPLDNRFTETGSGSILLPRHLPEPPEADPQVMLSSLPEKGKLLQAVMQAGPLLQSLLLAGPLPQWRHPPPTMGSEEIPRVSMNPSNVILPPVDQSMGLVTTHAGPRDQVVRLVSQNQTIPAQNGLCHSAPSTSMTSVSASIGLSTQNMVLRVPMNNGLGP
ncbi:hypothetical protein R1flu_005397 [Riccia fluitans]|uniref:Uncharacterized protein n=1 Tax=Riccia fluitans TaxID=41844 RepID=A0ABD1YT22_9MARC